MKANIFKIETLTNLHVGSGDANYGIIDNLIQRDPTTHLPTINGSSLKGALKEFFESQWNDTGKISDIFGNNDQNAGYSFLSANLVAIPVRSNKKAYFLATAPMVIKQLKEDNTNYGLNLDFSAFDNLTPKENRPIVFSDTDGLLIEDFKDFEQVNKNLQAPIFGNFENLVYFNDKDFKNLCNDTNLPVVARNKVGENLWYEQIVPHKSLFSFIVIHNDTHFDDFVNEFKDNIVHIGANATVGYGFTKISKI